jgi:HEAT repeat protein
LEAVRDDVGKRLRASIHNARFIDLEVEHDPAAVQPPWGYYNSEDRREFSGIWDAFVSCKRRMLLLGQPGSGKTTALHHLAIKLIDEAEASADRPVPLLVNLSKFRLKQPAAWAFRFHRGGDGGEDQTSNTAFGTWLISEMASFPGLDKKLAQWWLEEGRVAVLLDGLDEFNDEQRPELVRLLNETFLRDHPFLPVAICSRINEYRVLQSQAETKLQLEGSIQLEPLTPQQVTSYLEAARARELLKALPDDRALQELTKTPLTLSMLVAVYGRDFPFLDPSSGLSERRHDLFQAYVARMLQRQARRDQMVPFDDIAAHDVPVAKYRYKPKNIDRWLGWLALTLSVRMRTTFSPIGFLGIMLLGIRTDRRKTAIASTYLSIGSLCALAVAIFNLPLVISDVASPATAALLIVAAWVVSPSIARNYSAAINSWIVLVAIYFSVSLVSYELSVVLDIFSPWSYSALSVLCASLLFIIMVSEDETTHKLEGRILAAILVGLISVWFTARYYYHGDNYYVDILARYESIILWGVVVTTFITFMVVFSNLNRNNIKVIVSVAVLPSSVSLLFYVGFEIFDYEKPIFLQGSFTAIAIAVMSILALPRGTLVLWVLALSGSVGGAVSSVRGATIALIVAGAISTVIGVRLPHQIKEKLADALFAWLDRTLLSSQAWLWLAAMRALPFNGERFIKFTTETFLLKRSGSEVEFTHRLLRDYFALRELLPEVKSESEKRTKAIASLGYQGEAALDLLVELAAEANTRVRASALTAISLIAAPITTACIEAYVNDQEKEVRRAVVGALKRLQEDDMARLLNTMTPLSDGSDIEALLLQRAWQASEAQFDFVRRSGQVGVDALVRGLGSRNTQVRAESAKYLGHFGNASSTPLLIERLRDRGRLVRLQAAAALGELNDSRATEPLTRLLKDRDGLVRNAAHLALEKMRAAQHSLATSADSGVRSGATPARLAGDSPAAGSGVANRHPTGTVLDPSSKVG